MDSRNDGDLPAPQEGVYLIPGLGNREVGVGQACGSVQQPVEVSRAGSKDLLQVPARCEDEEEQGGARVLLPNGFPYSGGRPWSWRGGGGQERENWLHCIPYSSDFSDFSDFRYSFWRIANLYYL